MAAEIDTRPALFVYGSLRSGAPQAQLLHPFAIGRELAEVVSVLRELGC